VEARPASVVLRYALYQVPGTALLGATLWLLRDWLEWGWWAVWLPLTLWVLKDVALFPFVWRAYTPPEKASRMRGKRGAAEERLAPSGYVRVGAELWRAEAQGSGDVIEEGEEVVVCGTRGLTLLVRAARPPGGRSEPERG
jgi:membrane protein implicated in regulation of membrane protease activity